MEAKIIEVDEERKRISLSIRALLGAAAAEEEASAEAEAEEAASDAVEGVEGADAE